MSKPLLIAAIAIGAVVVVAVALTIGIPGPKFAPPGRGGGPSGPGGEPSVVVGGAALTVMVAQPEISIWPIEIQASGWIRPWHEAVISAEVGRQRIEAVNADVGDAVKQNDVLVELSNSKIKNNILVLEASLDSAQSALDQAAADAGRAQQLSVGGSISQQQISEYLSTERRAKATVSSAEAQLASAKLDLEHTRIVAVSNGVISKRDAALGDVVTEGQELFRLIRDNRFEWQAEIPLIQLANVSVGTPVTIPSPVGNITGSVRQIAPTASETNGRVIVYVALEDIMDGPEPKSGMMVSGIFRVGEKPALSVPSSAIVFQDGFSYVFVLDEEDPTIVNRWRVETGRRQGILVELLNDFPTEAEVVQSGGAFLSDGSVVRVSSDSSMKLAKREGVSE